MTLRLVCEYDDPNHAGPCIWWAGKPGVTSGNNPAHLFDHGRLAGNETGPGAVDAAPRPLATGPELEDR